MKQILLCVIGLTLLAGCALSHSKYYSESGKTCASTTSVIIGAGEFDKAIVSEKCGVKEHLTTKGTGFSDNFTEIPGKIVEGIGKGVIRGFKPLP